MSLLKSPLYPLYLFMCVGPCNEFAIIATITGHCFHDGAFAEDHFELASLVFYTRLFEPVDNVSCSFPVLLLICRFLGRDDLFHSIPFSFHFPRALLERRFHLFSVIVMFGVRFIESYTDQLLQQRTESFDQLATPEFRLFVKEATQLARTFFDGASRILFPSIPTT